MTGTSLEVTAGKIVCALYQIVSECNGADLEVCKNAFFVNGAL